MSRPTANLLRPPCPDEEDLDRRGPLAQAAAMGRARESRIPSAIG